MLNEIHGDGIPWLLRNWELFEQSVWAMSRNFGIGAGGTGTDVVFDIGPDAWPSVAVTDKLKGTVLAKMTREGMVVFVPEHSEAKIIGFRYVDPVV